MVPRPVFVYWVFICISFSTRHVNRGNVNESIGQRHYSREPVGTRECLLPACPVRALSSHMGGGRLRHVSFWNHSAVMDELSCIFSVNAARGNLMFQSDSG